MKIDIALVKQNFRETEKLLFAEHEMYLRKINKEHFNISQVHVSKEETARRLGLNKLIEEIEYEMNDTDNKAVRKELFHIRNELYLIKEE